MALSSSGSLEGHRAAEEEQDALGCLGGDVAKARSSSGSPEGHRAAEEEQDALGCLGGDVADAHAERERDAQEGADDPPKQPIFTRRTSSFKMRQLIQKFEGQQHQKAAHEESVTGNCAPPVSPEVTPEALPAW